MEEKKAKLEKVLENLKTVGDIEASAIVRRDGLMIASNLPSSTDARTIAAMSAALVGTSETSSLELKRGKFLQVIVEAENGKFVLTGAGKMAILACLLGKDANLGLVLLEMGRAAEKIASLLD